jgi:hypothetical protein
VLASSRPPRLDSARAPTHGGVAVFARWNAAGRALTSSAAATAGGIREHIRSGKNPPFPPILRPSCLETKARARVLAIDFLGPYFAYRAHIGPGNSVAVLSWLDGSDADAAGGQARGSLLVLALRASVNKLTYVHGREGYLYLCVCVCGVCVYVCVCLCVCTISTLLIVN